MLSHTPVFVPYPARRVAASPAPAARYRPSLATHRDIRSRVAPVTLREENRQGHPYQPALNQQATGLQTPNRTPVK